MSDPDRCYIGLPKWIWFYFVAPMLVAGMLGCVGWIWNLDAVNASQDVRLSVHSTQLGNHDSMLDRIDSKLDRILDRLTK